MDSQYCAAPMKSDLKILSKCSLTEAFRGFSPGFSRRPHVQLFCSFSVLIYMISSESKLICSINDDLHSNKHHCIFAAYMFRYVVLSAHWCKDERESK